MLSSALFTACNSCFKPCLQLVKVVSNLVYSLFYGVQSHCLNCQALLRRLPRVLGLSLSYLSGGSHLYMAYGSILQLGSKCNQAINVIF